MVSKETIENIIVKCSLGEKIAFFRKKKGFSQEVLAQKIGKTRSAIAAYENNIAELTIPVLTLIAKALEIDIYDLLYDLENEKENSSRIGSSNTYSGELQIQLKQLKSELEVVKKELSDKNKIIALYEERKAELDKKEMQIAIKLEQMEVIYNKIITKI